MLTRLCALLPRFPHCTLISLLALVLPTDRTLSAEPVNNRITIYDVNVLERRPYDRDVFTQGFAIDSDKLWVSSGLYGKSFVERWDWPVGENAKSAENAGKDSAKKVRLELSDTIFAEGLTMHKGALYLLTWKSQKMLAIDPDRLEIIKNYRLPGEGWGITSNGESLWLSDGTSRIREWRDGAFQRMFSVTLRGKPLPRLNELEWIDGEIWANVWLTDQIVAIAPTTGRVTRIIDLTNLLPKNQRRRDTDVLNGIAKDPITGDIWVTGKRWPTMYRIQLVDRQ